MKRQKRSSLVLVALVCSGLLAGSLRLDAAQGAGPAFQIFGDSLEQNYMDVAFNPATASYLVVWATAQDSYTQDLWARPVLLDGALLPAFNISSDSGSLMNKLAVATDTTRGYFLIVAVDDNGSGNWIVARTVNWNGSDLGTTTYIYTGSFWDYGAGPAAVYNPQTDEYLLVYEDTSHTSCSYTQVMAARLDPDSLLPGTPVAVGGCDTSQYSIYGRVAYQPGSNRYQVIYDEIDLSDYSDHLMTRSLSADLSDIGPEVEIASDARYSSDMSITSGAGGFLVTYVGEDDNGLIQVFGQFIDPNGNLVGSLIPITHEQVNQYGWYIPRASFLGALGYTATWSFLLSTTPPDSFDSYYRFVPNRPEPPHTAQMVLANGASHEGNPVVACVPDMQCLLVYLSDQGGDYDIYGRQIFITRQVLPLTIKR